MRSSNRKLVFTTILALLTATASCGDQAETPGRATDPGATPTPSLNNLGRVAGVGPTVQKNKTDGTEIVRAAEIPGLTEALGGRDVDRVIQVMEQAGIKHLLIEPTVARRNPIPPSTVLNRLALGRPAGRLSAKSMSRSLFHYALGKPPVDLSPTARKALIRITRDAFGGGPGEVKKTDSKEISEPGKWDMILTVRPIQARHLSFHAASGETLAQAARVLGKRARGYYPKFEKTHGPLEKALAEKLTLELEVTYDEGVFTGPRDDIFIWRIIEPGIHGVRADIGGQTYYLPPWYSVVGNFRTLSSLLDNICKRAKQKPGCWKNAALPIVRFRTDHWRERQPGGDIEALYRATPRVPSTAEVTRANLLKTIKGLGDWVADNQTYPSGRYIYRYFPTKDTENDEYNMVRHCVGLFSLALTQQFAPDPKYREKAEAGMKFIEDHIRWGGPPRNGDGSLDKSSKDWLGKPWPDKDTAIVEFADPMSGQWASKMGTIAVAILGYTEFKRTGWPFGPERQKVLDGLARFLLFMHDQEKGHFQHYYVGSKSAFYDRRQARPTRNSIYPGEILYAVARLYGETKDERYRNAFKASLQSNLDWFKSQMAMRLADGTYEEEHRKNLVQFQPWMAMAMDEMYRYDPNPLYVEASNLVSEWIIDTYQFDENRAFFPDYLGGYMKVLQELPAMHTFVYTEGTAASFDLARRAGSDEKIVNKLRKAALLSARFIMQQQTRPGENDYYYPNQQKAKGAVRYCMNHNKQRIDYTYHALSSIYRILRAATDADYASIQSIPMPKKW